MKKLDIVSFSVHVAAFILILCVPPCGSLYNCNVHPDQPILCQDNQISTGEWCLTSYVHRCRRRYGIISHYQCMRMNATASL